MIYLIMAAGLYALHIVLKMHWLTTALFGLYLAIRIPFHKKLYRKMKEEHFRFEDVSQYLETLLYAFEKEKKVQKALEDTRETLEDGPMRELVQDSLDYMEMTYDDADVMRHSLKLIEKSYPCARIAQVHEFIVHVELYGGEMQVPVKLLLEEKSYWEKRVLFSMKERQKMFVDILLSIAASLLICGMILYLPVMNIQISQNFITQILTFTVLVLDDAIFHKALKYLAVDWIQLENDRKENEKKEIEEYYHYKERREKKLSFVLSFFSVGFSVFCLWIHKPVIASAGFLLTVLFMNQHKVGRYLARKRLIKNIKRAFPAWLLDIILLLQSENVQVAFLKSMGNVPGILEEDLRQLLDRLEMEPESAEPFHRFLEEFHIPEVHSAMKMLYAVSAGNNGHADVQIGELIERNFTMLDTAERLRFHNLCSGMYLLFLAPVLTASMKLVVDMAVFMLSFMSNAIITGGYR